MSDQSDRPVDEVESDMRDDATWLASDGHPTHAKRSRRGYAGMTRRMVDAADRLHTQGDEIDRLNDVIRDGRDALDEGMSK